MLFSNFVATIRADLDAIKDDLGEFVTVVKSDTTAILGLAPGANKGGGATGASASQGGNKTVVQWDEELYDNPDLMCEDPKEDDWEAFVASNPVKEDEVEMMLSGSYSDLIPELYRELVPSRTTHSDFFKRLVYHRNRLSKAMKSKVHELVSQDEEETGWEDDDEAPVLPVTTPAHKSTAPAVESAALEQARKETAVLKDELDRVKEELARSQLRIEQLERMLEEKQTVAISEELSHKKKPVPIDVQEKQAPLTAKEEERAPVISEKEEEEEQQQEVVVPVNHPPTQVTEDDEQEEEEEAQEVIMSTPATTKSTIAPSVATASWEDLPTSPASSSNEEPVMLNKADELEEDDWE